MLNRRQLEGHFKKIEIVRAPKRRLATFGNSRIEYQLVTDVPGLPDRSRLRTGMVTAQKPQIITARAMREHFQGFGPETSEFVDALLGHYGEALRGLEYNFHNDASATRVELKSPADLLKVLVERHDADGGFHTAVIRGTDKTWELALMKFIVEETMASYASNVRELSERGLFDSADEVLKRRHREIEALLRRARADRSLISSLASKLKEYDLFDLYQDQFFRLVNP